ncbi:heparan-alpha-glucosaminide N-acetyltransferase domain-containing protein [Corynebacterium breve]|uniref:Heparan-alpha-glucosaminide N-acetyltransferase domain-containing protein n=1 Tax=Corynebacterium breve TaxID=3049799 RepID=A0ABY8VKY9_9CORY|nr:heparan-alpha-glucosaminide N-acetyltransferase domain-containing protein [Corynebacterium breve]WIM68225.1 heparan-alpha-glucosaminide N-acetyltransferase domain-containing protein [Corynebacterium breve]
MKQERLDGIDLARAIAILGMFIMHTFAKQDPDNKFLQAFEGRSTILFTVLAGVSVILMSRTRNVKQSLAQFGIRGIFIMALGLSITTENTGPIVILSTYGALYLVVAPLLFRAPGWLLAVVAAATTFVAPWLSFVLRQDLEPAAEFGEIPTWSMLVDGEIGRALELLFVTGNFPVLTLAPVFIAGMAAGRALIRTKYAWDGLIGVGGILAAAAFWVNVWALSDRGFVDKLAALDDPFTAYGVTNLADSRFLWVYVPHSGSITELIGSIGVSLCVIGIGVLVCTFGPLNTVTYPLRAVGRMPLTIYTAHIMAVGMINFMGAHISWPEYAWPNLLVPLFFAPAWLVFFKRGPLEMLQRQLLRITG